MRGHLINPFLAEIARLDIAGTADDPDAGGELTSGYDPIFRELHKLADGASTRKELAAITLPCQVEVNTWEMQQQIASGNMTKAAIKLVFHFRDLENAGLVNADGDPELKVNDRLIVIRKKSNGVLIQTAHVKKGGMYCTEAQVQSFGLRGGARNLLVCTFEPRERGMEPP